ncbi:WSC-domain-containing protein [Obba rivulosa]|uniref:WSC-domain-containing protein n=1 Tax=Obba rivulosa TaxID=1052685 RepID=A0A8E2J3R4_9APHY|nr:WSC-domain-containing protein [Obba rivulosa]
MRFSSTLRASLALSSFVAFADSYWIFGGTQPLVTTRLDPVVDPNGVGGHVHVIAGGSNFGPTYDYDTQIQSKCSTITVQKDLSNYWAPQLYYHDQTSGELTAMPTSFNIYYLPRAGPANESIMAFPAGLRMLAGNTTEHTVDYNASSFADQAISYMCLDYNNDHTGDPDWAERPDFFDHTCPDGLRAQIFFPSCWDGVNLDSADHKSHMAYPIQNYNSGDCPDSHPVHLVSLFYEMFVSVDQFPYNGAGTWVYANGDTTGRGLHGDFINGWADISLLQDAIDNCGDANGQVSACPPLQAVVDQNAASACEYTGLIVNEEVGLNGPISVLPGCNPLWDGTGAQPACPNTDATPGFINAAGPLPTGWNDVGCIAEGTNGRALTGASTTSPNMTRALCAEFCDSKGFSIAGAEFSDECYCDNTFQNGASNTTVTWSECSNKCAGNSLQDCGGPLRLSIMFNPTPGHASIVSQTPIVPSGAPATSAPVASVSGASMVVSSAAAAPTASNVAAPAPQVPSGWSAAGCVSDNGARTLNGFSLATDTMTPGICVSTCASKGFSMAGIEYGRECYCGDSFVNGGGSSLAASTCSMACSGDSSSTCGGSWALSLYKESGSISAALPNSASSSASSVAVPSSVPAPSSVAVPSAPAASSVAISSVPAASPTSALLVAVPSPSAVPSSVPASVPSSVAAPAASSTATASNSTIDLPAGWSAAGCVSDTLQRTLNHDAFTGTTMTVASCVSWCDSRGWSMAGLEYSRECYCGDSFVNGGGDPLPDSACDMTCPTDGNSCGGPLALNVYTKAGASQAARRSLKARHFGRRHGSGNFF